MRVVLLALVVAGLAACGTTQHAGGPAPVVSHGEAVESQAPERAAPRAGRPTPGARVQAYEAPPQVALARPAPATRAVGNLVERATAQTRAGDYAAAQASIERALRIEPRNAHLWNRLARLYLLQHAYAGAEQFAVKSNALAQGDPGLVADNRAIIAQSRDALGDSSRR